MMGRKRRSRRRAPDGVLTSRNMVAGGRINVRFDRGLIERLRPYLAAASKAASDVYLVGGAVRDLLSGRVPADLDFAVPGDPKRAAEAIANQLGGSPFAID